MLENPTDSTANIATIKRYAPPNQRNRSLGRRKSGGDRLERANSYANDGEKNQVAAFRNLPVIDHGDPRSSNVLNEYPAARLIALQGCCNSDAFQLLNNHNSSRSSFETLHEMQWSLSRIKGPPWKVFCDCWQAAKNAYENPSTDLAERPTLYSGSGASAWGQFRLPHQMMPPVVGVGPSSSQMDFLGELRRAMHSSNASSDI